MGRAPDSLTEWAGAGNVLKFSVNPQPDSPHEFLFPVAARGPPLRRQMQSGRLALQQRRAAGLGATLMPAVRAGSAYLP